MQVHLAIPLTGVGVPVALAGRQPNRCLPRSLKPLAPRAGGWGVVETDGDPRHAATVTAQAPAQTGNDPAGCSGKLPSATMAPLSSVTAFQWGTGLSAVRMTSENDLSGDWP